MIGFRARNTVSPSAPTARPTTAMANTKGATEPLAEWSIRTRFSKLQGAAIPIAG
jgi:hypothetical protein